MYDHELKGFDEFENLLKEFEVNDTKVMLALETGAKMLVEDVRKLPRPRSDMNGSGYTHLIDTISFKKRGKEVETGWGKYYGPMVERGTKKMRRNSHLVPMFERNKGKYYEAMLRTLF